MTKGKKITTNQVLKELKGPALIVLGIAGGSIAGKAIDKALKVDPNKTSFDVKALAKPIVQLSAGIGGALLLKDANMKLVASGVGASGVASSVKVLIKKDILSGFKGLGDNLATARQLLRAQNYNPNLPELTDGNYQSMQIEYANSSDNFDEYEEVEETEIL
ncbi:MAG: hypothetical protein HN600_05130 [Bacteroidetes bacterium]|nr:hypothetical protein [Bacteroidota bacterium]